MATSKNTSALDRHFGYTAKGSSFKTECLAGLTTFFAMAYILMVNAGMFSSIPGVTYGAIYIATAISAVIGTVAIGLLANLPLAQASGMGLNAYFVYTVVLGLGFSYANALVLVLFDGILFILLTVTGLRKLCSSRSLACRMRASSFRASPPASRWRPSTCWHMAGMQALWQ